MGYCGGVGKNKIRYNEAVIFGMVTHQIKLFCCRVQDSYYLAAKAWGKYVVVVFRGAVSQRLHYQLLPQQLAKSRQCSAFTSCVRSALLFPACAAGSEMSVTWLLPTVQ